MPKETSIRDIFKKMSFNDREPENTDVMKIKQLYSYSEELEEIKSLETAISLAREIYDTTTTRKDDFHQRATLLLDIGRRLSEEANRLSELQDFREKDYFLLIDFFNYYSNICYNLYKEWFPYDYVLVVLSNDVPCFILGAIIAAAFGADCPVIVLHSIKNPWFLFFLKKVFSETTLPKNFFNLVPMCENNEIHLKEKPHQKIVFLGHLPSMDLYKDGFFRSFSFVNLNSTATIILEFCDLDTAIDKVFYETWDKKFATMWGVSTAVVQESVYQKFLDRLKSRIDQLTDEKERVLIENCIIPIEDQNRKMEPNMPVLKVLSCRTANEGVSFLNSYQYYLGISIWSENSSQALEVASKLICKNVWINCHGIVEPSVPFQSSDNNGKVVFGGYEGILEYESTLREYVNTGPNIIDAERIEAKETILSAQTAFKKWLLTKNKEMYLTKIAESFKNLDYLSYYKAVIDALSLKNTNTLSRSCNRNFYVIHEKFPIGVIAIVTDDFDSGYLVFLTTTAIALGNAVVVVSECKFASHLLDVFNEHLPKGLLNLINEGYSKASTWLASDKIIQAVWLRDHRFEKHQDVNFFFKSIASALSQNFKRICVILNEPGDLSLLARNCQRECLSNRIIWLTKVDHFP